MLIDLDNKNYNKYLEIKGNKVKLNEEHFNLMKNYEYIIFSGDFNQPIDRIPNNVKIIEIHSDLFRQKMNNLPLSLESLWIENSSSNNGLILDLNFLPEGLKNLYIHGSYIDAMNLPNSIELLEITGSNVNININNLPSNLKHLYIESQLISTDIFNLPKNLQLFVIEQPHFYSKIHLERTPIKHYPYNILNVNNNLQKIVFTDRLPLPKIDDDTFEKFLEKFPQTNKNFKILMNGYADPSVDMDVNPIVDNSIKNLIQKFKEKITIKSFAKLRESSYQIYWGDIFCYHHYDGSQ